MVQLDLNWLIFQMDKVALFCSEFINSKATSLSFSDFLIAMPRKKKNQEIPLLVRVY